MYDNQTIRGAAMTFNTVKVQKVSDAVYDQLLSQILNGQIKPNDKLPNEISLSNQLSVSRSAIREALRSLQEAGLVERSKEGTKVKRLNDDILLSPLERLIRMNPGKDLEALECRGIIEVMSSGIAAERANQSDIELLKVHYRKMETAQKNNDRDAYVEANIEFHRSIVSATHNSLLTNLYISLTNPIKTLLRIASGTKGAIETSMSHHKIIIEAIENRDAVMTQNVVMQHLLHTGGMIKKSEKKSASK